MNSLLSTLRGLVALLMVVQFVGAYDLQYCSSQNSGLDDNRGEGLWNSYLTCTGNCSGFAFGILQYQTCWCSNYAPSIKDSLASCNLGCPGYPSDNCGSRDGLFAYLALGPAPSGTFGVSSTTTHTSTHTTPTSTHTTPTSTHTTPTSTHTTPTSTHTSTTRPSTTTKTTPSSTRTSTTKTSIYVPPTTSSYHNPSSSSYYPSSSSPSSTPSSSPTSSATHSTSIQVVTSSGDPTTRTVTLQPTGAQTGSADSGAVGRQSLSNGATAGIVIGAIAGVALLALLGVFLWRRRRNSQLAEMGDNNDKPPKRTTSVLSRTGLLSRGRQSMIETNYDDSHFGGHAPSDSLGNSMLYGAGLGGAAATESFAHSSPLGSSNGDNSARRPSRPLVYDQRLNPSALFASHDNGSRISMQDNNDYSRPLGIVNPDIRPSFESRRSNWD